MAPSAHQDAATDAGEHVSSEYTISLRDEVTSAAARIRAELQGLRSEARAIPDMRVRAPGASSAASSMRVATSAARSFSGAARATATASAAASNGISGWVSRARHYISTTRQMAQAKRDFNRSQREAMRAPPAPGAISGGPAMGGVLAGVTGGLVTTGALMGVRMLNTALRTTVATITGITAGFAQATVSAFDFRTRATMAFQAMRGDGEKEFGRLTSLAVEMGTSLEGTFAGIRALSAAGFGASEAEQMFKRLQDMKGIGLEQGTLDRLVLAISQIKGAGQLQGDELRQIQETGISVGSIWDEIAKSMGVSVAEAKKLKEAGKVSADVAIPAIMAAMAKMAGGGEAGELGREMGRKTSEGFGNRASLIKQLFFDRIAKDSEGGISRVLETANEAADSILGWMESADARSFFAEIGSGITTVANDLRAAFQSDSARKYLSELRELFLGAWRVGEGLWSVAKAYIEGFSGREMDLSTTKDGLQSIAEALKSEEATRFFRSIGAAASAGAEMVLFFTTNIRALASGAQTAAGALGWLLDSVVALHDRMVTGGTNAAAALIQGFVGGLQGGIPSVIQSALSVGQSALSSLMGSLDAHSPSRAAFKIGGWTTEGLGGGMVANDNASRAAATVAGGVRAELATGLGVSAGSSSAVTNQIGGDVVSRSESSSRTVSVVINVTGGMDAAAQADLERQVKDLFARVA